MGVIESCTHVMFFAQSGLRRCGKSCRLRWLNYLRPNIKHGDFTDDEDRIICSLFASIGSRWSIIAAQLPGRTDNDIKNYWNTKLKKKLMGMMMTTTNSTPSSQKRILQSTPYLSSVTVPVLVEPSSSYLTSSAARSAHTWPGGGSAGEAANYYTTQQQPAASRPWTPGPAGLIDNVSSISSSLLNTISSSSLSTAQEGYTYTTTTTSMQNYDVHPDMSILRFGGEASSSSSDGSSTYDYGASNVNINNNNNQLHTTYFGNGSIEVFNINDSNNYVAENPLDDSLEEIKQLISTNLCNNFFVHEIKTEEEEEKVTYF